MFLPINICSLYKGELNKYLQDAWTRICFGAESEC